MAMPHCDRVPTRSSPRKKATAAAAILTEMNNAELLDFIRLDLTKSATQA